jgi:hypothetical protein
MMRILTEYINCIKLCGLIISIFSISWRISAQTVFTDITGNAGIDHQFKVYEGMFGGGACVFDLNNDGFEDLYLTGGMNSDQLYLNQGNGTFLNIFEGSGLEFTRHFVTQGVGGADVNKDGWIDLYITTITSRDSIKKIPREINLLFLNNGNNTFTEVTQRYGLENHMSFSTGVNFGDFNADGYPDMYVANYFQAYDGHLNKITDETIVNANNTAEGYLLINHKGKKFDNLYKQAGLSHRGFGFGAVFTDYDNDGDQDLFVHHDFGYKSTSDLMLQNNSETGIFADVSKDLGLDLKINSMGTAIGDYDNDGDLDYFITNIKFNQFMENQGPGLPFREQSELFGKNLFTISWGANFADFDHDGDLDLFVANGDLNPNTVPMNNYYFENNNGRFSETAIEKKIKSLWDCPRFRCV